MTREKELREGVKSGLLGGDHNECCVLRWALWGNVGTGHITSLRASSTQMLSGAMRVYSFLTPVDCTGSYLSKSYFRSLELGLRDFSLGLDCCHWKKESQEPWRAKWPSCLQVAMRARAEGSIDMKEKRLLFSAPAAPVHLLFGSMRFPISPFFAYVRAH